MDRQKLKVDRSAFSITSLDEQDKKEEKKYWQQKTANERLEALEITRQIVYGYDPATTRLQRGFEIAERT